jgi:hypothetical protein
VTEQHPEDQQKTSPTKGAWPTPAEGAPYTDRSLTALGLARTAVAAADSAAGLVPTGPPGRDWFSGLALEDALRFLADARSVVDAAVLVERAHNTSWDDIAETVTSYGDTVDATGAEQRWGPMERDWEQQRRRAAMPGVTGRNRPAGIPEELADPDYWVEHLDGWVARRREFPESAGSGLVSEQMQRMDAFVELGLCSSLRDLLRAEHLAPPPELLAPIYDREAELCDAMAAAGHTDYVKGAARCRARAAELRAQASTDVQ